ncbi:MAG TPA: serpin family protein [Fermentimonas caenicola]|jgi:serine protease inhibitor|uniref:Serpin n=1 Tax=Fermentimonas caenicola TaxID=1562970 RepID=A0A098BZE3_9BACT|nr:serpin family protein [Lascolabacillus sp.]MBP6174661.1 serpin family protein [Fermentimonas sp.]MDI9625004.1 serpin family protein [Bacteroidota bacterium]CEA15543.1 serpin [Fermentimonas caenicola]MBP6195937.1 serpin family protein [Fermentimonas sp.]MBP7104937.1 serpin family protein [Fermentimonas sp.]
MNLKITTLIFVTIAAILSSASCEKGNSDLDKELPDPIKIELRGSEAEMVKSDQQFAIEFFANVFNEEAAELDKNFMISPLSLSMALAMTWNGADGETKAVMQKVLKLDGYTDQEVNEYYEKLREALLKTDPSTKLAIANSIWTNKNIKIKDDFIRLNNEYFNSTVESVDFSDANSVKLMNKWAADNTNNLITHVLDKTNPNALMYLMNALYFKGIWTSEFNSRNTSSKPFYSEDGQTKNVDMMHQKSSFNYNENQTMQIVELPYGNQAFSMIVLLPKEGNKLADVTQELQNSNSWGNLVSGLRSTQVDLYLPKFKTEYSRVLNDVLEKMGMGIAFEPGAADFSRMTDADAFISFVEQFTYINTDEVGTEAAAVTVVGIELTSYQPDRTATFNANRPFIYIIRENSTGSILFMGAVKYIE